MYKTLARAAAVALLATVSLAGPAAADASWTVGTAANDYGADRDNYAYTVEPGGRVEDGLVVANHGTTRLDLAVYAADAFTTRDGHLDLLTRDTTSTGLGRWVHPGQDRLTVEPGQSVEVPFSVSVPGDAAPGDHLGGIVTSLEEGDVERRVGVRIHLRVGGALEPRLSVGNLDVSYSGAANPLGTGDATLTYTIHNTGNAIVAARQSASVSGPFGTWRVASARIGDSPQLLPGETWQVSVPVHGVTPALQLTGTVTLTPLLTDAAGSTAPLSTVETTSHGSAIPWTLLLIVVVLCGLVMVVMRRRRRNVTQPEDAEVSAPALQV